MRFGALLASVVIPTLVFAQTQPNNPADAPDALSKAKDWGAMDFKPLEASPIRVRLHLTSSWIPGENRQGMLRYKMSAFVLSLGGDHPSEVKTVDKSDAMILDHVFRCLIVLELHDKDDFIVRTHRVPFKRILDEDSGLLESLLANDAFQISAQEYRQFLNGGSWTISWTCQ